jgi:hypothetical protein
METGLRIGARSLTTGEAYLGRAQSLDPIICLDRPDKFHLWINCCERAAPVISASTNRSVALDGLGRPCSPNGWIRPNVCGEVT